MGTEYVSAVEAAIASLKILSTTTSTAILESDSAGYMFEEWEAGTFNVDAVAADSADRAVRCSSHGEGPVDSPEIRARITVPSPTEPLSRPPAQARFNPDTGQASYQGQAGSFRQISSIPQTDRTREALRKRAYP